MIVSHKPRNESNPVLCTWDSPPTWSPVKLNFVLCLILNIQCIVCTTDHLEQSRTQPSLYLLNVSLIFEAIQTKEFTQMNFKSHTLSDTIALLGRLSKEGELVKVGIVEKVSKNFERAWRWRLVDQRTFPSRSWSLWTHQDLNST